MTDELSLADRFVVWAQQREIEKAADLPPTEENRLIRTLIDERRVWVDVERLQNLHRLATSLEAGSGAFVECGVAKGGCLAMMAAYAGDRLVWGFDSFEGLPGLTHDDAGSGSMWVGVRCSGPSGEQAVDETFKIVGVPMDNVRVVSGWFSETLPEHKEDIGPIALLRIDADWYDATSYVLRELHNQVIPGGAVVIDDYGSFEGCRRAVDEFRSTVSCSELLHTPGSPEAYWYV